MLRLEKVNKSYGSLKVVDDFSLEVASGEVLGVIGPNGAGKTSLFSAIAGQVAIDSGKIFFNEKNVTKALPYRRCLGGMGRTFQVPQPFKGMTVFESARVAANFGGGMKGSTADDFAINAVAITGLLDSINTPCAQLTLLDRKRLELTRALATNPSLLLLDEIGGGLTDHEIHELIGILEEIRRRGISIIWIEHIVHALMSFVERLIVINFGVKIADGEPKKVMVLPEVHEIYLGLDVDDAA
ncbi:MAG: ATP-binding cassette domain-containing protein [Arenicellales bacterium]|mgnify:FL=1|jgi:branched-chain amino acid transport system ATP-binding protein|nr:ATP-binding cassette domain-containing protein [Rhodospirillales bacterium]MDP7618033.1 ATP-binding cassette domain-containing protein [Arenicellales bacterium]HJP44401.1 ATP-binding cassette domain-containing protein [Arenicellales bacterium]